jgi:UDPglucose--hexose-1-phosphate uridylyltransferase
LNIDLRVDPLSGRLVAIAPARANRPGADAPRIEPLKPGELDECPFCEGREDRTPPEVLALPAEGRKADTPGWTVRVVPNLYPALERQEVVVHGPEHVRAFAELSAGTLEAVAEAWRRRVAAARDEGFSYVHAIVNEGRPAGASLPHSHSQLIWLREPPPEVAAEAPNLQPANCALCRLQEEQSRGGPLLVAERDGVVLLAAPAGRAPYELVVAGEHAAEPGESLLTAFELVSEGVGRLHAVEGPVPWNAWLHSGAHWHFEVVPRLTVFAGLELGAGVWVNSLAPERAAEALRA